MNDSQPNILLITTDHWSGRWLRAAGHPAVMTPTLDQLCRGGIRFSNAYSLCPICIPARRSLMTGTFPRTHGDRSFKSTLEMPPCPSLAETFRENRYQAYAVGKLHVYPQRNRIGFHDVILNEEARRTPESLLDDWEQYLADRGYRGLDYSGGGCQNDFNISFWNLPEDCHPTVWAARQMARTISRKDPTRPAFWYLSFVGPHPPLWPTRDTYELYQDMEIDDPVVGDWVGEREEWPHKLRAYCANMGVHTANPAQVRQVRRAFYATLTHIDQQIRVVLGTLRERGLLGNTWVIFTSDHGEMLGDHRLWNKSFHYEGSCRVPLLVVPPALADFNDRGRVDDRLACLEDVMPTALEAAGLAIPDSVEGLSLLGSTRRDWIYGEHGTGRIASRMVRDGRFKLIYYPEGNRFQLFDLEEDPCECHNLSDRASHSEVFKKLRGHLAQSLYGGDEEWVKADEWSGLPKEAPAPLAAPQLGGQRGLRCV